MRHARPYCLALLIASLAISATAQPAAPRTEADAMATFQRMTTGEWSRGLPESSTTHTRWSWGPGRHSVREMMTGVITNNEPWRTAQVFYWHPKLKRVRFLGLAPFARSVWEGSTSFDGERGESEFDLFQARDQRRMVLRWTFRGADEYTEELLERINGDAPTPLAQWDYYRLKLGAEKRAEPDVEIPAFPDRLGPLERFLGRTWDARYLWDIGEPRGAQATFEWIPFCDLVYARVVAPSEDGEPERLLDAYLYHHTGANELRCLVLDRDGGVTEGKIAATEDDGALRFDLTRYEGDAENRLEARFEFGAEGAIRMSASVRDGADQAPLVEALLRPLETGSSNAAE